MKNKVKPIIGWREWISLPDLSLPFINTKIDTGAKTSSLHAYHIKELPNQTVEFCVHPIQRNDKLEVKCAAKFIDHRSVKSSTGHTQHRYVIESLLVLGGKSSMNPVCKTA